MRFQALPGVFSSLSPEITGTHAVFRVAAAALFAIATAAAMAMLFAATTLFAISSVIGRSRNFGELLPVTATTMLTTTAKTTTTTTATPMAACCQTGEGAALREVKIKAKAKVLMIMTENDASAPSHILFL